MSVRHNWIDSVALNHWGYRGFGTAYQFRLQVYKNPRKLTVWSFKMGSVECPETSVTDEQISYVTSQKSGDLDCSAAKAWNVATKPHEVRPVSGLALGAGKVPTTDLVNTAGHMCRQRQRHWLVTRLPLSNCVICNPSSRTSSFKLPHKIWRLEFMKLLIIFKIKSTDLIRQDTTTYTIICILVWLHVSVPSLTILRQTFNVKGNV
jgi:hypothetical protein